MKKKSNTNLLISATRLVLARRSLQCLWIIIVCVAIGLIITTLQPVRNKGLSEILVSGSDSTQTAKVLSYIVQTDDFYNKVREESKEKNLPIDTQLKSYDEWNENVKTKVTGGDKIIKITIIGEDKTDTLNQVDTIKTILTRDYKEYVEDEENLISFKIVTSPRVSNDPISPKKVLNIALSLAIGIIISLVILITNITKIFKKRKNQRQKYVRYVKLKKNASALKKYNQVRKKELRKKNIPSSPKRKQSLQNKEIKTSTEEQVKDKLNRLIRGEDILSEISPSSVTKGKKPLGFK